METHAPMTTKQAILEVLSASKQPRTVRQIASAAGKSRVAVNRYVKPLVDEGLVQRMRINDRTFTYALATKVNPLATMSPRAVDERMCEAYDRMHAANNTLVRWLQPCKYDRNGKTDFDKLVDQLQGVGKYERDAYAEDVERAAKGDSFRAWRYRAKGLAKAQDQIDEARRIIEAGRKVVDECNEEWQRRGCWSRFNIVPGGHVHSATTGGVHCGSIRWSRVYGGYTVQVFAPQYSGMDAAEVIKTCGERACTRCFPDAPVAPRRKGPKKGQCKHSGEVVADREYDARWACARYHKCKCGKSTAVTTTGKLRAHAPRNPDFAVA